MAYDPEAGSWCNHESSVGAFCPTHAREFRCDEAAKLATRLLRAEQVLRDPSTRPSQRWRARRQNRRFRSLRQLLLAKIERSDGVDTGMTVAARGLVRMDEINRLR